MLLMAHAAATAHMQQSSSSHASSKPVRAIGEGLTISSTLHQRPLNPHERYNMHVLFLSSDDPKDHVLNRLTSALGARVHRNKGFCHTEICIPDLENPHAYLSSSIYNGETVTLTRTKTFANPGYTVVTFTVTRPELVSITNYLHEAKRMQLRFDAVGMYLAALPFQLNFFGGGSTRATFCSKHVTHALRCAGIEAVLDLNENIVTPSKLYRVLKEKLNKDRLVAGTVDFKQRELLDRGAIFTIQ